MSGSSKTNVTARPASLRSCSRISDHGVRGAMLRSPRYPSLAVQHTNLKFAPAWAWSPLMNSLEEATNGAMPLLAFGVFAADEALDARDNARPHSQLFSSISPSDLRRLRFDFSRSLSDCTRACTALASRSITSSAARLSAASTLACGLWLLSRRACACVLFYKLCNVCMPKMLPVFVFLLATHLLLLASGDEHRLPS